MEIAMVLLNVNPPSVSENIVNGDIDANYFRLK
jgi:hypothetical protein